MLGLLADAKHGCYFICGRFGLGKLQYLQLGKISCFMSFALPGLIYQILFPIYHLALFSISLTLQQFHNTVCKVEVQKPLAEMISITDKSVTPNMVSFWSGAKNWIFRRKHIKYFSLLSQSSVLNCSVVYKGFYTCKMFFKKILIVLIHNCQHIS